MQAFSQAAQTQPAQAPSRGGGSAARGAAVVGATSSARAQVSASGANAQSKAIATSGFQDANAVTAAVGSDQAGDRGGDPDASSDPQTQASTLDLASAASAQGTTSAVAASGPVADQAAAPNSAASQTVANLAAQIAQKAGGQTTRFDVQLDPLGLGRVNVSVEIDAKGAMSAALSFEKPESANLLKSHSAELQQSLSQAGFDLPASSISFSATDQTASSRSASSPFLGGDPQNSGGQQSGQGGQAQNAGRAFGAASFAAEQADQVSSAARGLNARGVDIRI